MSLDKSPRIRLPSKCQLSENTMKRTNTLCALLLAVMLIPDVVMAQACPGSNLAIGNLASAKRSPATATAFIGPGCSVDHVGGPNAPLFCYENILSMHHEFRALWSSTMGRTTAPSSAGCRFNCLGVGTMGTASPSCFVRASDGLPVELMEFSVE